MHLYVEKYDFNLIENFLKLEDHFEARRRLDYKTIFFY